MSPPFLLAISAFLSLAAMAWGLYTLLRPPEEEAAPTLLPQNSKPSPVSSAIGSLAAPPEGAERDALRQQLVQAGFFHPRALELYLLLRASAALLLPVVALIRGQTLAGTLAPALVLALAGYYLPSLVVYLRRESRHSELRKALPNALDMLVSCLEAGLGLDAALRHVATELRMACPVLSDELSYVNAELSAGIPRADALRHLDTRTGLPELASLVNVLSQAERYGAGIASSIRAHAQLTRRRRLLDAERRAAEATPKLTVAMILFVLPPLFVVLLGPAVINITDRLLPSLQENSQ
ncbi:MAG TPA: type II secretion system F family protein [Myxococcota bacterium]|nr:type II secretion system F family protein [Myxococcota bacterium]